MTMGVLVPVVLPLLSSDMFVLLTVMSPAQLFFFQTKLKLKRTL